MRSRTTPSGRNSGTGRVRPGQRAVPEETRVDITQILLKFQASSATEYTFPATLSNDDRAIVHSESKKMGFESRSYGKGTTRRVTVFKNWRKADDAPVYELPISAASVDAVNHYFRTFPVTETELQLASQGAAAPPSGPGQEPLADSAQRRGGVGRSAAAFTPREIEERRSALLMRRRSPQMRDMGAARQRLPVAEHAAHIVELCNRHQVVLVAGETGCGKSTQVPQFLLEGAWAAGRSIRCVCTQPRRISAVSVAERVAAEMGEGIGCNVGYSIRLESRGGPDASLLFCTNGVLLRMLTQGDGLEGITHIIVDEVHERDRFADFMLIILRDLLPRHPRLRLVLMSATLHVGLFSDYFGGCPVVEIPGFTHNVCDFYLEDVLQATGFQAVAEAHAPAREEVSVPQRELARRVEDAMEAAFLERSDDAFQELVFLTGAAGEPECPDTAALINHQHPETGATPLMVAAGSGRSSYMHLLLDAGAKTDLRANDGLMADEWADRFGFPECADAIRHHRLCVERTNSAVAAAAALSKYQEETDADEVDIFLILKLILHICGRDGSGPSEISKQVPEGAVLVFLPGWDDIIRLKELLQDPQAGGAAGLCVLPLHSMIAPSEQRKIFLPPPPGARKVVLATNIAETAITIEDVVCVIDSGRLKEKSYDPYTGVSTLQSAWISKASERQRRGRAGRCRPGVAVHLYSRLRSGSLAEYQLPEIRRCPLDELCLQVKLLDSEHGSDVHDFLNKAVEPPAEQAVVQALDLLEDIGAIDKAQRLTQLGRHLAALPLQPKVGKMLLTATMFKVLDPLLTVACSMAYRDPWVLPAEPEARRSASRSRRQLSDEGGGASDHMALVAAYDGWRRAKQKGRSAERDFCQRNFVSAGTMQMLEGMRRQLSDELRQRGLADRGASANAQDLALVRAVLACGMYPQVGRLQEAKDGARNQKPAIITRAGEKISIHASSVNSSVALPEQPQKGKAAFAPLMAYDEVMRSEVSTYVRQSTGGALPHALLLVAGHVRVEMEQEPEALAGGGAEPQTCLLTVDSWLRFKVPLHFVAFICCLRLRLSSAFSLKVANPKEQLPEILKLAVQTISLLLSIESSDDVLALSSFNLQKRPPRSREDSHSVRTPPPASAGSLGGSRSGSTDTRRTPGQRGQPSRRR
mmetsp:Transcript_19169/g.45715  ORF Transcript_19169/g.45715 Transcript_19169/m.45715 type:complete len:1156 (-) Transcript_19169:153-3620(-)